MYLNSVFIYTTTSIQFLLEILKHDLVTGSPLYMNKHLALREGLVKGKSVLMPKILENSFLGWSCIYTENWYILDN